VKILSMQATFGKLDNETITFQPGLNVIHAPNEWGKSTWCAFLCAMLYGIDSKDRSALADKRRYAPWSGKPMSGRMELEWKGRRITLERSTAGLRPFGNFAAYETESGLPVPELSAENCGQVLLGVEKSVFEKTAFIRHSTLPITQDETLRRRLHALITTGDESATSDRLEKALHELKNKCRYNKSGLLPQAEAARDQTADRLAQLRSLQQQQLQTAAQYDALTEKIRQLEIHKQALAYEAALADMAQLAQARQNYKTLLAREEALAAHCKQLPAASEAEATLGELELLQEQLSSCSRTPPVPPVPPVQAPPFQGLDAKQIRAMVQTDLWQHEALANQKQYLPYFALFLAGLAASVVLAFLKFSAGAYILPTVLTGIPLVIKRIIHFHDRDKRLALECKYGDTAPTQWLQTAEAQIQALEAYAAAQKNYEASLSRQQQDRSTLEQQIQALTQGQPLSAVKKHWEQILAQHDALAQAVQSRSLAQSHLEAMEAVVKTVDPPKEADPLTLSGADTQAQLAGALAQQQRYAALLGQLKGQAGALGDETVLQKELEALCQRIDKLKQTEQALTLAQQTLKEAAAELQRQFAPRISRRAAQLLRKLTNGRYDRLTLDQELCVSAGTTEEDTLHTWHWRSDGTVDQLYLALRMAVAEELLPEAPLILDDALVLFDDQRLEQAMDILRQTAIYRQVILFSCQNREKSRLNP